MPRGAFVEVILFLDAAGGDEPVSSSILPGTVLIRDPAEALTVSSATPVAMVHVVAPIAHLPVTAIASIAGHYDVGGNALSAHWFVAFANTVLNMTTDPDHEAAFYVQSATEGMLSALILELQRTDAHAGTIAERRLYRRATAVITARSTDRELTVDEIARELAVSRSSLQAAFRSTGMSPLQYLNQVRAQRARSLLDAERPMSFEAMEAVARATGFRSVRTMRRMLNREPIKP